MKTYITIIIIIIIIHHKRKVKGKKKNIPRTNVSQNINSEINAYIRNRQQYQYFLPILNALNTISLIFLKTDQIIKILHSKWILILHKS